MFRRIAALIDVADVLGLAGLAILAYGAYLLDPRLTFFIVGGFLLLVAIARSLPDQTPPPAPPASE